MLSELLSELPSEPAAQLAAEQVDSWRRSQWRSQRHSQVMEKMHPHHKELDAQIEQVSSGEPSQRYRSDLSRSRARILEARVCPKAHSRRKFRHVPVMKNDSSTFPCKVGY